MRPLFETYHSSSRLAAVLMVMFGLAIGVGCVFLIGPVLFHAADTLADAMAMATRP